MSCNAGDDLVYKADILVNDIRVKYFRILAFNVKYLETLKVVYAGNIIILSFS